MLLTIEGLITVLGFVLTVFSFGYNIGYNIGYNQAKNNRHSGRD